MKKLSTIALVLALALPAASLAAAQDHAGPPAGARGDHEGFGHRGGRGFSPERIENRIQMLTIMLRLDTNQQRMVREIATQVATELQAARAAAQGAAQGAAPGARDARRAAHRQIMERAAERVDAVLNTQQRQIFDRMREVFRARQGQHDGDRGQREGRQGARGGHGRGARLGSAQGVVRS